MPSTTPNALPFFSKILDYQMPLLPSLVGGFYMTSKPEKTPREYKITLRRLLSDTKLARVPHKARSNMKHINMGLIKVLLVEPVGERSNFKKIPTHMQDHGDA